MSNRISDHDAELIRRADELLKDEYEGNADFNAELDAEGPLQIGDVKIERSEALFWVDRVTYADDLGICCRPAGRRVSGTELTLV